MDLSGSTINWKPYKDPTLKFQIKFSSKIKHQPVRAAETPAPETPRPWKEVSCRWPDSGQTRRSRRPAAACSPRQRNRCAGTACPESSRL